jgi:hypothetical protein
MMVALNVPVALTVTVTVADWFYLPSYHQSKRDVRLRQCYLTLVSLLLKQIFHITFSRMMLGEVDVDAMMVVMVVI